VVENIQPFYISLGKNNPIMIPVGGSSDTVEQQVLSFCDTNIPDAIFSVNHLAHFSTPCLFRHKCMSHTEACNYLLREYNYDATDKRVKSANVMVYESYGYEYVWLYGKYESGKFKIFNSSDSGKYLVDEIIAIYVIPYYISGVVLLLIGVWLLE
jgi:hypothetical protein